MICLISFSKFLDVLTDFTCAGVIGNLGSICLGVNIFSCLWLKTLQLETLWSETLATRATRTT